MKTLDNTHQILESLLRDRMNRIEGGRRHLEELAAKMDSVGRRVADAEDEHHEISQALERIDESGEIDSDSATLAAHLAG